MKKKGIFIVIEGLDGSGKTTQAKILARKLRKNYDTFFTVEPSDGRIGSFIRKQILYDKTRPPVSIEALLFAADRIDHIINQVQPALNDGKIVISDRYIYSSLAYQGSAGLHLDWIETINQFALKPDLALFIDVSPEIVLDRLKRKKSNMEKTDTQRKVYAIYEKFIEKGNLIRIDGEQPKKEVADTILKTVQTFLEKQT
ncbi:MAG: dTMP kinase [Crenarchaeota archaeon]|nr:dTMP kinase [Thermoproteota archaeon]